MRKRKPPELPEHPSRERWLVSYADFITLLFAFFTTMYAISTVDAQKMGRLVYSMRASFDSPVFEPGSANPMMSKGDSHGSDLSKDLVENVSKPLDKILEEDTIASLKELKTNFASNAMAKGEVLALGRLQSSIEKTVRKHAITGKVRTRMEARGLVIEMDGTFFDSGSDQLRPEGRELMASIAQDLLSMGNHVRIEGHTDNIPIHTSRFPSNWELSTARATYIVSFLIKQFGFPPDKLASTGYAEYIPIADNRTAEGRARNRRVEIIVLSSFYSKSSLRQ